MCLCWCVEMVPTIVGSPYDVVALCGFLNLKELCRKFGWKRTLGLGFIF